MKSKLFSVGICALVIAVWNNEATAEGSAEASNQGPQLQVVRSLLHPGYLMDYGHVTITSLDRRPLKILSVSINGQSACTTIYQPGIDLGRGNQVVVKFPQDAIIQSDDHGAKIHCPEQPGFVDIGTSLGDVTFQFNN